MGLVEDPRLQDPRFLNIIICVTNIIIFIIINICIIKNIIFIIKNIIIFTIVNIINKFEKTLLSILKKNHRFDLKGKIKNYFYYCYCYYYH
jgi:hypothetical protein